MLKPAIMYKDVLEFEIYNTWFKDKYSYAESAPYNAKFSIADDTWSTHEFVSVNSYNNVLGYIAYQIDRCTHYAYSLVVIAFSEAPQLLFGKDVFQAVDDIFCKYNLNKLKFTCVVGNPIEQTYDKLVDRYGGRIVGVYENDVTLQDGTVHDLKLYELLRRHYILHKTRRAQTK